MSEKWIKSSFDKCFELHGNNTLARAQLSNVAGRIQDVHYGDVLVKYFTVVDCDAAQLPRIISDAEHLAGKDYVKDGDIVFADTAEDDTVGKAVEIINVGGRKVVSGLHTIFARPRFQFAPTWLGHYVNSNGFHSQILPYVCGSKVSSISRTNIRKTCVVYPQDISTQRHIAEVLATCDEVIEKSERAAEKYRQIKAGMLKDLLTRGLDKRGKLRPPPSVAPELYKGSELGPIPKEWEVKRLGDVGRFVAGNGFPLVCQGRRTGKYPFYKVSDFNRAGNEQVMVMANNCIDEDVAEQLHCSIIPKDAIVFAKIGAAIALERKRKVSSSCCIDNNMMSFQVCDNCDVDFVLNHLQQQKFGDLIEATALPALKTSVLKMLLLPIPVSLAEQRAIAERLAAVDERIAAEVKTAEKYRKVKAGLMEKLLTPPADAEIEDLAQEVAG